MGLDWCLNSLEKDKSPLEHIGAERCDLSNDAHVQICNDIIESYRKRYDNKNEYWNQDDETLLKEMEGQVLVDTIDKEKYKNALASLGSFFSSLSGVEAFRGKIIEYSPLVPEDMQNEAFAEMDSEAMLDYADRLRLCIRDHELNTDEDERDKESMQDVWAAIHWLEFWAQHPVKMVPWY